MNHITSFIHNTFGNAKWRMKFQLSNQRFNNITQELLPYSILNMEYDIYNRDTKVSAAPPLSSCILVTVFHKMCDELGVTMAKRKFFAKKSNFYLDKDVLCVMFCLDTIISHTELFKSAMVLATDQLDVINNGKSIYEKFRNYMIVDPTSARKIIISTKQEMIKIQRKKNLLEMDITKLTEDDIGLKRSDTPAIQNKKINTLCSILKEKSCDITLTCKSTGKFAGLPSVNFVMNILGKHDPIDIDIFPIGLIPTHFPMYHECMLEITDNVCKKRKR